MILVIEYQLPMSQSYPFNITISSFYMVMDIEWSSTFAVNM